MKDLKYFWLMFFILIISATTGCSYKSEDLQKEQEKNVALPKFDIKEANSLNISRIFGLGYPGNDDALYLATNDGLKMYKQGKWTETTVNTHKFMGFQALENGFISSGHPQKGTGLKDPLGLVRSENKGETLEKLAFYGETNFAFMAADYSGEAIYVISEKPKEGLSAGVNYSKDRGKTWKKSEFKDFRADSMGMIAVQPNNGDIMAMATRTGIYYSNDNGNTMQLITDPLMVTALTFSGDSLLYSSVENEKILLKKMNPITKEQISLSIPYLDYDNPITYLSVNPKNQNQMAFTTYKNDLYESSDGGKTWNQLLDNGKKEKK
ncbi:F510_1955 family glycosylhydrolase [Neobacillus thermocopriae]|uniref:Exo-alpha-sialidase n=1 Tax=Neobacillus thermocopriae TaxID=1215031 RepID=A0A6B3TS15_9BACI|nr:sialidase family protein [Neobacillus thermocopriae]MED3624508.1 sialidase family protein [Neobacillus thermocopriae]MED3715394.1 sialidase family protein [Neobacillus thermocopriae]NEX79593.1 exo-alpha-sialidase [Neobacillus thermocopriae]